MLKTQTIAVAVAVAIAVIGCSDDTDPGGNTPDSQPPADANMQEAGRDSNAKLDIEAADGPVTPGPDGPVTVKPDGPVTPAPDGPVTVKPDGPVTPVPDGSVTPVPDGPVTSAPDGPVAPAPDGKVTPAPDGKVPDGKAPDSNAVDGPKIYPDFFSGATCTQHCDCAQGEACITNKCATVGAPVYCCSKTPCPTGQACVTTSNTWTTCSGGATGCKQNCDCNQGEACQSGKCLKTTPLTYCCAKLPCPAGTICTNSNGSAGFCPGGGTTCTKHCDCPQGQTCLGGNCTAAVTSYCCAKSACPSGKACYKTDGTKSYCP